ncbi:MAG: class I SAM-dependent methyltransferase, partial [Chloroflexota bacterium]
KRGSDHHQKLAIPALLDNLALTDKTTLLDIGCGTGVLAPYVHKTGATYTGIDIAPRLIKTAKQYHGASGTFHVGDARKLVTHVALSSFDACTFLLSIQDMNPLAPIFEGVSKILKPDGSVVLLLVHPCFRIPRQSGWGYEKDRKLQYRRIDRYLSPLKIPMKQHKRGTTISFHRPLSEYINTLGRYGLLVDKLDEITTYEDGKNKAERRANDEIPLFMLIRARKG